jgi:hypothetical protein
LPAGVKQLISAIAALLSGAFVLWMWVTLTSVTLTAASSAPASSPLTQTSQAIRVVLRTPAPVAPRPKYTLSPQDMARIIASLPKPTPQIIRVPVFVSPKPSVPTSTPGSWHVYFGDPKDNTSGGTEYQQDFGVGSTATVNEKGQKIPCTSTEQKAFTIKTNSEFAVANSDLRDAVADARFLPVGTVVFALKTERFNEPPFFVRVLRGPYDGVQCWYPFRHGLSNVQQE